MSIRKMLFSIGKVLIKDLCYLILTTLKMLNTLHIVCFMHFIQLYKKRYGHLFQFFIISYGSFQDFAIFEHMKEQH